jgi:UDP-glucuronate 4-epimerase
MNILVTGCAGFIGFHASAALLARGHCLTGIDSINSYYDPALKHARLTQLEGNKGFRFVKADIASDSALESVTGGDSYQVILHLAAQAGIRYALTAPKSYTQSNLVGHHNVLEFARRQDGLQHLVYASSSSVYGNDSIAPFSEDQRADHPVSYYGATKRAGELLSHSYAELFGLRQTGLRFFTVYGDWGRPDMAYWLFTDAILHGRTLPVFGQGQLRRDFTHVDDIVSALIKIVEAPFVGPADRAPHEIFNLGNSHPESVLDLIRTIEAATARKADIEWADGPQGDVRETYADITRAQHAFGFAPRVPLGEGIDRFVHWFRNYARL